MEESDAKEDATPPIPIRIYRVTEKEHGLPREAKLVYEDPMPPKEVLESICVFIVDCFAEVSKFFFLAYFGKNIWLLL